MIKPQPRLSNSLRQLCTVYVYAVLGLAGSMSNAHADALNGKSLYLNGPTSGGANCATCHGASPANNVNGILAAANNPAVISNAFAQNKGGMGSLYNNKFSSAEIADLAAFIGNPSVTAAPVASLSPSSLTFGGANIGQAGSPLSTTLANTGSAPLNIGTIAVAGNAAADYSITGGSCANGGVVATNASCTIIVGFKPTAAGTRSAAVNISHNATGGSSTLGLTGTGNTVPLPTIGVSATSVNFGSVVTNVPSAVQTIVVSNSGQAALVLSGFDLTGANPGVFTLGGTCKLQAPIALGDSCTVTVQASATASGPFSANLNLVSNASNGGAAISLSGTGAAPDPRLAAHPNTVVFGLQTIGSSPASQFVTLSNTGNVVINLSSLAVTGSSSIAIGGDNHCGATLAVGASCAVPVAFTPAAEGDVAANLVATTNAATVQVAISGTGTTKTVARPALSEFGTIAFTDTQVGKSAAKHTTTLSNPSSVALKITTLVLSGSQLNDFALGGTCSATGTISPAGSCTIESTFKPSAAGSRTADLLLISDSGEQFVLSLVGNGVAIAANNATLTISPQSFDFGAASVGGAPLTKRFALSNTGTSAVSLTSEVFSGPFSAVADATGCPSLPFALQPGSSCDLVVQYAPAAAGTNSGNVVIQSSDTGSSWTISFTGEASVPPAANQAKNGGGGGCSAIRDGNDASLVLMVLLALAVIAWRQRRFRNSSRLPER